MTGLADGSIRITHPQAMHALPARGVDVKEAADRIADQFEGLLPGPDSALRSALASAIEYFHARSDNAVQGWAIVSEPQTGQVDGIAMLKLLLGTREWSIDEYVERLQAARATVAETATWVRFDIFSSLHGEVPHVGYYRLEIPSATDHPVAIEEALVARLVPGFGILEARVIAQDLGAFDDVVSFAAAILSGTEFLEDVDA
jgi:hypothetical protein